jgi:hypothetical protein
MIKKCSIIFLVTILLMSLFIQLTISIQEGQEIITKDDTGSKFVVTDEGEQKKVISGDGSTYVGYYGDVLKKTEMNFKDAGGDKMWIKDDDGVVSKNPEWNKETAFPDYHASASELAEKDAKIKGGKITVKGPDGKLIEIPWTGSKTDINYNEPGYFRFQPSSFIPNYEDSVYLSRLTGFSTNKQVDEVDDTSENGGFCNYHKDSPIKIEKACGKLDKNTCGSTSCCVLLGGSRCVGGNENGPTMKANYGDITIRNRDHYYYQGKCYGNCPY